MRLRAKNKKIRGVWGRGRDEKVSREPGVGGALGGWGAPLAVAPGAALPWWRRRRPRTTTDNAQLFEASGSLPILLIMS